jgi:hypothetical protein
MRRFLAYAFCIAGMIGFFFVIKFLVTGISEGFGDGLFTGVFLTIILMWGAERVSASKK